MKHGLTIAAGVGVGLCAVLLLEQAAGRTPATHLVSDVGGELAEVSLHYCEAFHAASFPTIADFVSQLDPASRVNVVVARQAEFDRLAQALSEQYDDALPQLHAVVTGFAVTPWSKDRYGTMRSKRGAVICVPEQAIAGDRVAAVGDKQVPALLASDGVELRSLPFRFDGGDLICSDERIFMAANCLARNQPYDQRGRAALIRTMAQTFGKPITLLGHTPAEVPPHHIGMYLTPLGDGKVMVGDPDLGLRLYRESGAGEVDQFPADDATLQPFRHVIHLLEEGGFDVVRVPLVVTSEPQVYMTYNNGIAESRDGEKSFYMPVYGIPALDDAAAACYERCGYIVKRVRVASLYRHTGSLRCLVGIVRRAADTAMPWF